MTLFRFLSALLLSALTITVYAIDFNDELPPDELASSLLDEMSDNEALGQVMMLGYMGEVASDEILEWIRDKGIGGVKIFGWNANDLKVLAGAVGTMQQAALENPLAIPLIIATDQEGGWVRHIKGETSITPGNLSLGASGQPYDSYMTGYYIGMELRRLGINMNFAPDVDVYLNPLADVIGPRAFSQDPVQTGVLGTAFFKGQEKAGVISTAKHYPGHGNADKDSHGTLPVIPSDRTFWESHDLVPYKMMIREGLPAVMAGHLAFPEISGDMVPATLNPFFLKEILRNELNYKGLIITDDLVMGGSQAGGLSMPEVCEQALRAGSDFLLVSRNPRIHQQIWEHLSSLMERDSGFRDAVREAAHRVLTIKADYLRRPDHVPFIPSIENIAADMEGDDSESFFFAQAARSTTLIRSSAIPVGLEKRILCAGLYSGFRRTGEAMFASDSLKIPYAPDRAARNDVVRRILDLAPRYDHIIFSLSRYQDLMILKELSSLKDKIIILSSLTPIYVNELPWVKDAVAVYGTGNESYQAGLGAIRGDFSPGGSLPIDLEP